jgi:hypothetical protein
MAMTPKLSKELAREIERTGAPLSVEDPRTHKLYVIVSADEYKEPARQARPTAKRSGWNEAKNARRFALIDKEIAGTITPAETDELANLQREVDDYLDRVAPLPLDAVRDLHDRLVRQAHERAQG